MRAQLGAALEPMPGLGFSPVASAAELVLADRWVFSRLLSVTGEMDKALTGYRFHEAAHTIYHFFWHELCDWYLEWVKPEITREGGRRVEVGGETSDPMSDARLPSPGS